MAKFLQTRDGMINLDLVATVHTRKSTISEMADWVHYIFRGLDGKLIGEMNDVSCDDLLYFVPRLVPAAAGQYATLIMVAPEESHQRPVLTDVFVDRRIIVAWQIERGEAFAILDGNELTSNEKFFIERPDGKFDNPNEFTGDDLEAAKQYCLDQAQRDWDKKQATPAVKVSEEAEVS